MVKTVINKLIILLLFTYTSIIGQQNKQLNVNQVMIDSTFNFSDYQYNYAVIKDNEVLLRKHTEHQKNLFAKLNHLYKSVYHVEGILLADAKWGGAYIESTTSLDFAKKSLTIKLLDFTSTFHITIDSISQVHAVRVPNKKEARGFSGEVILTRTPSTYEECYVFLRKNIMNDVTHPNFSYKNMNRILEGYMLFVHRGDQIGTQRAYLVIFRSFIDIKDVDEWKLERK